MKKNKSKLFLNALFIILATSCVHGKRFTSGKVLPQAINPVVSHKLESHNNNHLYHVKVEYKSSAEKPMIYRPGHSTILNIKNSKEMIVRGIRYKQCADKKWIEIYKHEPDDLFGIDWGTNVFNEDERNKLQYLTLVKSCPLTLYYVFETPSFYNPLHPLINQDGTTVLEFQDAGFKDDERIKLPLIVTGERTLWSYE